MSEVKIILWITFLPDHLPDKIKLIGEGWDEYPFSHVSLIYLGGIYKDEHSYSAYRKSIQYWQHGAQKYAELWVYSTEVETIPFIPLEFATSLLQDVDMGILDVKRLCSRDETGSLQEVQLVN